MKLVTERRTSQMTAQRAAAAMKAGGQPGPEVSTLKLKGSALNRAMRDVGLGALGADGMLVLNVACRAKEVYEQLLTTMCSIFGTVLQLRPDEADLNRVLFALPQKAKGREVVGAIAASAEMQAVLARRKGRDKEFNVQDLAEKLKLMTPMKEGGGADGGGAKRKKGKKKR